MTFENNAFSRLINLWLEACRLDGLSPKTIHDYRDKALKFRWYWFEFFAKTHGEHPKFVTVKVAREFAAYLREPQTQRWGITEAKNNKNVESLSNASIAAYGRGVKVFFNWLEREGHITTTPFNKSVKFTNRHQQDKVIKSLPEADLKAIFRALADPERRATYVGCRDLAMTSMLLDSGIRRGELLSIKLSDLDTTRNRVMVSGKTGKRWALFSDITRTQIELYINNFRRVQGDEPANLWLTPRRKVLTYAGFGMVIRRIEVISNVDFHTHQLRHTFATMLASNGVSVFELKALLGHSTITTTQLYVNQNFDKLE